MDEIIQLLKWLQEKRFFGKITLEVHCEDGGAVRILNLAESIRPTDIRKIILKK
jgi:hypothetical protein